MKKSLNVILALVFSTTLFFVGCRKKETTEVDNETQSAVDNAVADQEYAAIVPAVNSHAIQTKGAGGERTMATCDSLTKISGDTLNFGLPFNAANYNSFPTYTMNVSNSSCNLTMPDGKLRTGAIWIKLTDKIKKPGAMMIIKLLNYKTLGAITYSCDSIVVTTQASSSVTPKYNQFNIKLIGGVCQKTNWTIKYSFDRTVKHYVNGDPSLTATPTDPVTYVWGTANGINREGRAFNISIPSSTPLVKRKSCEFVQKGLMELTPDGFKTRTVDFGNGTCDDDATFTVNGNTVAFKLK